MVPTLAFIGLRQLLVLGVVCLPLTLLWGYALLHSLRKARAEAQDTVAPAPGPLDAASWALLIVLTGWFGAVAYLCAVVLPRAFRGTRAGARLALPVLMSRGAHAPVP